MVRDGRGWEDGTDRGGDNAGGGRSRAPAGGRRVARAPGAWALEALRRQAGGRGDWRLRAPEPGDRRRARRRGTDRGRLRSRSVLARTRSTVAQGTGVSLGRRPADPVLAGGGRRGRWPAHGGQRGSGGAGPRGRGGGAWAPPRGQRGGAGGERPAPPSP